MPLAIQALFSVLCSNNIIMQNVLQDDIVLYLPFRECCPLLETFSSFSKCFLALRMLICVAADAIGNKNVCHLADTC